MNKYFYIVPILLILGYVVYYIAEGSLKNKPTPYTNTQVIQPSPTPLNEKVDFKALFLIFTNGTKRIFTDSKYHNRSADIFITAENPEVLYIKKTGLTWGDFFKTLPAPMKVEKTCLHTGTGQSFCNSDNQTLKFYVNRRLDTDALSKEIKKGDELLISFGPKEDSQIEKELNQF